jgi:hypothetical protein
MVLRATALLRRSDDLETILIFLIENQQLHQNYHFIVMLSQTLLHVPAYQRHHQGAHMILTSYLFHSIPYSVILPVMHTDI